MLRLFCNENEVRMALSRKLGKLEVEQPNVEALIMKGGSSGDQEAATQSTPIKRVQLRVSTAVLDQIDGLVKKRAGNVSRHTWIMEAIEEKLERLEN